MLLRLLIPFWVLLLASHAAADEHWSFRPITKPTPPAVKNQAWVRNPIDAFILAKLEAAGLTPSPRADALTLLRRATFDLIGLPPTLEEMEWWEGTEGKGGDSGLSTQDSGPSRQLETRNSKLETLLARLLASPHYGERYGRHWLDVARYEQGRVSVPGVKNIRGDQSYRDYVVRAFNKDKPFNQFILEQIAGDLMTPPNEPFKDAAAREQYFDQITAPAFLSIGNWFDQCTDPNRLRLDMVDEMLTTTGKAFLGLNFNCARCHDHKFDPITARDYYALAGIFRSTRVIDDFNEDWRDGRVRLTREMATQQEMKQLRELRGKISRARRIIWDRLCASNEADVMALQREEKKYRSLAEKLPAPKVYSFEAEDFTGQSNIKLITASDGSRQSELVAPQTPGDQWVKYSLRVPEDGTYQLSVLYVADEPTPMTVQVNGRTVGADWVLGDTWGLDWLHRAWSQPIALELKAGVVSIRVSPKEKDERMPHLDRFRWMKRDEVAEQRVAEAAAAAGLSAGVLWRFLIDPQSPYPRPAEMALAGKHLDFYERLLRQIREAEAAIKPYDRTIAIADNDKPTDLPIFARGEPYAARGQPVPRGVPKVFDSVLPPPTMPNDQSGRLELAHWLADKRNPLTARVIVNRVWQWHFGRGLVETPNDFGTRGAPPSHPELLDWLASDFIEHGWSLKHLHKTIMSSATYQQAVGPSGPTAADPANKLYWRFDRRRLEVEAIYDAMLATSGKVARQREGPLDFNKSADRMMYVLTSGRSPPTLGPEIRKMFAVFDYDPAGEPIGRRGTSTTAAQALFWLNNPIPKHFAGEFARELLKPAGLTDEQRLSRAYLTALCRPIDDASKLAMLAYLKSCLDTGMTEHEAWRRVCLAIYSLNEFRYVD